MISFPEHRVFWWLIGFSILALYVSPLILFGEYNYIRIHDNLDIMVPTLKILAHSGFIFADSNTIIPNMMGGLPRLVYGSEFNYLLWLFVVFEPFTAIVINEVLIHIVAYFSMVSFLMFVVRHQEVDFKSGIIHIVSILFALTPFFPSTGLAIALLPYATLIFCKIRSSEDMRSDWIKLVLIPFFGNFVLVYLFFLFVVVILIMVETIYKKQINKRMVVALIGMGIIFLLIEYRLVEQILIGDSFVSHRIEFQRKCVDFMDFYRGVHNVFLFGQSHSLNLQFPYVLAFIHLGFFGTWFRDRMNKKYSLLIVIVFGSLLISGAFEHILMSKYYLPSMILALVTAMIYLKSDRLFLMLIFAIILFCGWYGFWYFKPWCLFSQHIAWLQIFDFSRFVLLLTPIWSILLALSLVTIMKKLNYSKVIVISILLLQTNLAFDSAQFYRDDKGVNYRNFYDENLYRQIRDYIGSDQSSYRVASVGIHPAVALYNGFYTLDGYAPNYPLSYKHQFQRLIEGNFQDNPNARRFIQNWGSKCYLIAGQYDYDDYQRGFRIENFYLNTELFKQMGGRYLLSGYVINHAEQKGLRYCQTFRTKNGIWEIVLYEIL